MDTAPHPGVNKKRPLAPGETSTEGPKTGKNPKQKDMKDCYKVVKFSKYLKRKLDPTQNTQQDTLMAVGKNHNQKV